jgi:hypothetical protein
MAVITGEGDDKINRSRGALQTTLKPRLYITRERYSPPDVACSQTSSAAKCMSIPPSHFIPRKPLVINNGKSSLPFDHPGALPMNAILRLLILSPAILLTVTTIIQADDKPHDFKITWKNNYLTISGDRLPGKEMKVMYLEAYCRPGSTDRVWSKTTIGHQTKLISARKDGRYIKLRCTLNDGVIVDHEITVVPEGVEFKVVAHNPTKTVSQAHWAQPCIRVGEFTGRTQKTYLSKSFLYLDNKLSRMPTKNWATKARYIPGQVWCPKHVNRNDVNPRPLSEDVPSNGMIGCFSKDGSMIMASVWEPYQELFQGVIVCVHSDFRIGGLKPGESKNIRGKIYLVKADPDALMKRYRKDFPEHFTTKKAASK